MANNVTVYTPGVSTNSVVYETTDIGSAVQRQTVLSTFPAISGSQVITRPADTTAYAANDLVANSTTAGSVAYGTITVAKISAYPVAVSRLRIYTNHTTGLAGVVFNVRLWASAPTFTNGDNGAYAVATGYVNHLAKFQGTFEQFADGAICELAILAGDFLMYVPSSTTLTWDMQTLTAFTPQSGKTFTLFVEGPQG